MRQLVVGIAIALLSADAALANGRPAGTSTINFRQGNEQEIAAGMTFGLVLSKDGGETWQWMCEKAIKYSGMYDPFYAYTSSGSLFATTFDGALVNRDGCNFDASVFGTGVFVSTLAQGPDGALYFGLAHPEIPPAAGDAKIYKSTDNGMSFPISADPGQVNDWWSSIVVAPSNAQRVYVSGYRLTGQGRDFLLFRSNDGGATYQPMAMTGLTTTVDSTIDIVGVAKTNPDHLYAKITFQIEGTVGDGLFRSTDGGGSWTKILDLPTELAFVVRANGDLVVGTKTEGAKISRDNGDTWDDLPGAPHINCLVENSAGEVWACTQNFGSPSVMSDEAGIMKSTDLVTWTTVLRYQDIEGPVECPSGTLQNDRCVAYDPEFNDQSEWCNLRKMYMVGADPTCCRAEVGQPIPECALPPDEEEPGCCDSNTSPAQASLLAGLLAGGVLLRKRRRR